MGTHAIMGVRYSNGTMSGCYIHFDGGTMEHRIEDFVSKNTVTGLALMIAKAQARGGIRSFHCPPHLSDGPGETEFLDHEEPYIINEDNWRDDHYGANYSYIIDYDTGRLKKWSKYG